LFSLFWKRVENDDETIIPVSITNVLKDNW
jgi:hypothetical protein